MAKRPAESDDDSGSESSASASREEEEVATLSDEQLYKLQKQAEDFPTSYEAHMQYISALRSMKLWDKLKDARRVAHKRFPFPEDAWLEWIEDEKRQAEDRDEKEEIIDLYKLAVQDYRSLKIWDSYGQYVQILSGDDGASDASLNRVREVYEEAIVQLGLDIARGPAVWEAFRDFEERLLDVMMALGDARSSGDQVQRVRNVWKRQLAVPLVGMDAAWSKYVEFETVHKGSANVAALEPAFKAAKAEVEARIKWEKQLPATMNPSQPDLSLLPVWYEYLAFEESKRDPGRIQTLYERVICSYCLVTEVWLRYLHYLESNMRAVAVVILPVIARAVRNCPWQASLWTSYIRAMERYKKPQAEIDEVFERAQAAGLTNAYDYFAVFEAYLDVFVRKADAEHVRKNFANAVAYFDRFFADSGLSGVIQRNWAGVEAFRLKATAEARKLFEELLKKHSLVSDYWVAWINFERQFGDAAGCRSVLKRAVNTAVDVPERVFEAWLKFEREFGDLDSFEQALHRVEAQQKLLQGRREKEAAHEAAQMESQRKAQAERAATREKKGDKAERPAKGKRDEAPKRRPADDRGESERDKSKRARSDTVPRPSAASGSTIHVSNLAFATKEEQLQEAFGKFGPIKAVRLVRDNQGRLKGFAFIDFETEAAARAALALDRTPLSERTISVALATIGAPTTSYETNTLFVSQLPLNLDENALRTLFTEAGGVKDVRLIRNGKLGASKGYGYVEMADEASLIAALKFHQREMQGKRISVVRSLPPRKTPGEASKPAAPVAAESAPATGAGAGGAAQPSTADGKTSKRLDLGPVPRSLKKAAPMKAAPKFVPASSAEPTPMQTDEAKK